MDKITRRYEEALKLIRNSPGSGGAWGHCVGIAKYALTRNDSMINEEDKLLIDESDKIPVIWGKRNK